MAAAPEGHRRNGRELSSATAGRSAFLKTVFETRLFRKQPTNGRTPLESCAGDFFDAPLGQGSVARINRGRRPLTRPCPRLISCGVPPGRALRARPFAVWSPAFRRRDIRAHAPLHFSQLATPDVPPAEAGTPYPCPNPRRGRRSSRARRFASLRLRPVAFPRFDYQFPRCG